MHAVASLPLSSLPSLVLSRSDFCAPISLHSSFLVSLFSLFVSLILFFPIVCTSAPVWEIEGAEFTYSPKHTANAISIRYVCMGMNHSLICLLFPLLLLFFFFFFFFPSPLSPLPWTCPFSPSHTSFLSRSFPRVKRIRDDKDFDSHTDLEQLEVCHHWINFLYLCMNQWTCVKTCTCIHIYMSL